MRHEASHLLRLVAAFLAVLKQRDIEQIVEIVLNWLVGELRVAGVLLLQLLDMGREIRLVWIESLSSAESRIGNRIRVEGPNSGSAESGLDGVCAV
jgi:hypothetical protein